MTIYLEPCTIKRYRGSRRNRTYYDAPGIRARRRGNLLMSAENHLRVWVSEERARKTLERDFPGEIVLSPSGDE